MTSAAVEARRAVVAQLVLGHFSVRAIAADIGVSKSQIQRDIEALRLEWQESRRAAVDAQVAEDLQRLTALERTLWPGALRGDLAAMDRLLRIQERRSRLLGLDAPAKVELDVMLRNAAQRVAEEEGLDVNEVMEAIDALFA